MTTDHPFWPQQVYTLACTTSSATVDISNPRSLAADNVNNLSQTGVGGPMPNKNRTIVFDNVGPDRVFINWGTTAALAAAVIATAKYTIPAGSVQTITIDPSALFVGAICATSTATLYVIPGRGE